MDPLSAMVVASVLAALATKTVGAAVTDVAAQVRGRTPPSLEKWRARQQARAARGEAAERDPGPWRRRWRNAVEYRTARAAQRHAARMELLRDNGVDNVARHKARLVRRAARRDRIGATVARLGATSWEAANRAAAAAVIRTRDAIDERRAWRENEHGGRDATDRTDTAPDPADTPTPAPPDTDPPGGDRPLAPVVPLHPDRTETPEPAGGKPAGDTTPQASTAPAGDTTGKDTTSMSTDSTSAAGGTTEITDLNTAITFGNQTAKYTDDVIGVLTDMLAQLDHAMAGLNSEASGYERAKANLTNEGLTSPKITNRFDAASEALSLAAQTINTAIDRIRTSSDHVSNAGVEMRAAVKVFNEQLTVSESVGAAKAGGGGVARTTAFYGG